jgi:shikimate 5-dehydrogenase
MYPHVDECPPLPYEAIDTHTLLYDLIYNPDETLFMKSITTNIYGEFRRNLNSPFS